MQELEVGINMSHIKQLAMQLSNVASTKSPPQGDTEKAGILHVAIFQTTLWTVFTPSTPTILGLRAAKPYSSIQTGYTKPTFKKIIENFDNILP
jgi:hypothetical protein